MKILLCCKVYPTSRPGGMGFVCQDRARQLVKMGHDVHVVTTRCEDGRTGQILDEGVVVQHFECEASAYSKQFAEMSETYCRQFVPNILHTDSFSVDWPWQIEYGRYNTTKTAATMHGFCCGAYFTKVNMWLRHGGEVPQVDVAGIAKERRIMFGFGRMLAISRHEHWMMTNLMGVYNAKLVYNPIPDYFYQNINKVLPEGKRRFLCAAVTQHKKRGFDIAEKAAREAGVDLITVSDKRREEMPAIIDSCHGLVLPTVFAQGMDLTVAETIARRRPVIATATGSYQRECESGGIYQGAIKLFPLDGTGLAGILKSNMIWWDWRWTHDFYHGVSSHANKWLEVILE